MVEKLLPKTEGNTGSCLVCASNVTWVKKTYQGKESLTLRNVKDNKAHNIQDGSRNWVCNTATTDYVVFDKPVSKVPFEPKVITEEQQAIWTSILEKAIEYTLVAEQKYDLYPQMDNPAKRGMVTKLAYDMMEHYQKVKDNDD